MFTIGKINILIRVKLRYFLMYVSHMKYSYSVFISTALLFRE